ncbi:unnamed protein product [Durusdinium trenchii]|uniref:Ankyrin repeat protein RF_0381 n=2 Tax=Durusdinium trenchii TaxID=1381693 RepID=A0ABP0LW03_9DINO
MVMAAWCACPALPTPLASYAETVRTERASSRSVQKTLPFPMYVISTETLLKLRVLLSHEELLADSLLTEFHQGHCIFVSHQWLSGQHPDPSGVQFKVLQDALRNILSGSSQISVDVSTELMFGRPQTDYAKEMRMKPLYVWYDYFCVPQKARNDVDRSLAISLIPEYVARCKFFVVLAPPLRHTEHFEVMSRYSWCKRGWCRMEWMAREYSFEDAVVILVTSAQHQTFLPQYECILYSPGNGSFAVENDREKIGHLAENMILKKLHFCLEMGDLHNYRFFLNQQTIRLEGLRPSPFDDVVPGFDTEIDPSTDSESFLLERFMYQNGFVNVSEYDEGGWPPICFAAMKGDPTLIEALLERKANPNDRTLQPKRCVHFEHQMCALSMCSFFRRNEAMRVLLEARADPDLPDGRKCTSLHWACAADNVEGLRILLEVGGDPFLQSGPGPDVFGTACACGATQCVRELLLRVQGISLKDCFFWALLLDGGSAEQMKILAEAKGDINEPYVPEIPALWMMMGLFGLKHHFSPSRLTNLAKNHRGCTPLMYSVLSSHFEATVALIALGADLGARNSQGKTAADLAREVLAPQELVTSLQGNDHDDTAPRTTTTGRKCESWPSKLAL